MLIRVQVSILSFILLFGILPIVWFYVYYYTDVCNTTTTTTTTATTILTIHSLLLQLLLLSQLLYTIHTLLLYSNTLRLYRHGSGGGAGQWRSSSYGLPAVHRTD